MLIIPNSTTEDESFFARSLSAFAQHFSRIHIDIQDGIFVPNKTLTFAQMLPYLRKHAGILFDFHVQTTDAQTQEALISKHSSDIRVNNIYTSCGEQEYESHTASDSHLIMTIDAGPQGQPFKAERLQKIHALRAKGYTGEILLDGGINATTISSVFALPETDLPDGICIGSYFSQAVDTDELTSRIQKLQITSHVS